MRKKARAGLAIRFVTDPLCPWSWAMERTLANVRAEKDAQFWTTMGGWLPSSAIADREAARQVWTEATRTGARIDPMYWERVGPKTSLVAAAATKAAELQGIAKGDAFLAEVRRSVFESANDPTNFEHLAASARAAGLNLSLFQVDIGQGRYGVEDLMASLDPAQPVSEGVWWFGRRRMLRTFEMLADDLRAAERGGLPSPAIVLSRGDRQTVLRGFATETELRAAIRSLE